MMPFYTDQLNRKIEINNTPQRIVSLVPSQTELLHDLGLEEQVAGITKFCVHPKHWHMKKPRVGGTKNINIKNLLLLNPDLVIANKEENTRPDIDEISKYVPVWVSDVNNLPTALQMIKSLGEITCTVAKTLDILQKITQAFADLENVTKEKKLRAAYLIWQAPYMTVGLDTFIHDMLCRAGFENVFATEKRYPIIIIEQLQKSNLDCLLLSTEPFPFQQKHMMDLQPLLPKTKLVLADGEMFSWYGSRLLQAPAYFIQLYKQLNAMP